MERGLKQSQQAMQDAKEAGKRWIACQARAEELAHYAERLFTRAQELKDDMNKTANRNLTRKAAAASR